ncbi:uncharacterized protein F4812DRAFT_470139 [Daldinia caldariorum]|uniref:uncharacterized protein n=1 Tax=Daldinia caldariorum TaxID=326644 RepID=UPI002007268F|nr:uncharacterized protein F4812DRAFT_470139 [Daldinia caldariorum]KAI1470175.1 hypothetical protein F4812DRAFT_470139 [Daldinia caldariorum]
MNATVELSQKFGDWSDEVPTSWTSTMFTSPFGEGISVSDPQLWASPGNNSDEYYRSSPNTVRDELAHQLDTSGNFESGYNIDDSTAGADVFVYDQYPDTQVSGQSVQPTLGGPFAEHTNLPNNTETVVNDSTPVLTKRKSIRRRFSSRSSETNTFSPRSMSGLSPCSGSSLNWTVNGPTPPSPDGSIGFADDSMPPNKHRRNRERNRVAAHKCRQKAKQSMSELQTRERELSQQNRMLQEHAGSLRDEILDLKNEILRHSSCDSDIIQNYIARAAREVH